MQPGVWVAVFLPMLIITMMMARNKRLMMRNRVLKNKKCRGDNFMNELIMTFLGKKCHIYTFEGTQIKGVIEKVEGNWVSVRTAKDAQIVNADFISRIRQSAKQ